MIELKRDGQLCRFFDKWDIRRPTNLCELFWKATGVPLLMICIGSGLVILAAWLLVGFGTLIAMIFFGFGGPMPDSIWGMAIALNVVGIAAVLVYYVLRVTGKGASTLGGTKAVEIAREGFRGIKDKYCPTVTWR